MMLGFLVNDVAIALRHFCAQSEDDMYSFTEPIRLEDLWIAFWQKINGSEREDPDIWYIRQELEGSTSLTYYRGDFTVVAHQAVGNEWIEFSGTYEGRVVLHIKFWTMKDGESYWPPLYEKLVVDEESPSSAIDEYNVVLMEMPEFTRAIASAQQNQGN